MAGELCSHAADRYVFISSEPCEAPLRVEPCEDGRRVVQGWAILKRFQSCKIAVMATKKTGVCDGGRGDSYSSVEGLLKAEGEM